MGSVLASPRRRRRLAWLGAVTGVALAVLLALVFMRNTAPPHKETFSNGRPSVYVEPKPVAHNRFERVSAISVAAEFLRTALRRQHVDRSWVLTEPNLHVGFTRAQWDTGQDLPFPPFNFREVRWRRDYSYRDRIGLQVAVFPAKTEKQRAMVFYLDLKRHGRGKHEHWLVSEFAPAPGSGSTPPGIAEGAGGGTTGLHISMPPAGSKSPLSAYWLLLPLSGLSLIVLLPLALGIRGFIRNRRAAREYVRPLHSEPEVR
jgi:hypothetical protein